MGPPTSRCSATSRCWSPGWRSLKSPSGPTVLLRTLHFPPGNAVVLHGLGVSNEYPLVLNRDLFSTDGYDGVVEPGMVLCVESLVAPAGRPEAVKLEEQVLITETGTEVLSAYPFSAVLLD